MMIATAPFKDRNSLFNHIENILKDNSWQGSKISSSKLGELVHSNLRIIVSQNDDQDLQNLLFTLSNRIRSEFDSAEARNLSFEVMGIAMGVFSQGEKPLWVNLPVELWVLIFSHLANDTGDNGQNIVSGLRNVAFCTKKMKEAAFEAKKQWVNHYGISLKTFGCTSIKEAVDCVIKLSLSSANLCEYSGLTDEDLSRLIAARPNLKRLMVQKGSVSDVSISLVRSLSQLQVISLVECENVQVLDLSACKNLEKVRCINCIALASLSLPKSADGLKRVDCIWSSLVYKHNVTEFEKYQTIIHGLI